MKWFLRMSWGWEGEAVIKVAVFSATQEKKNCVLMRNGGEVWRFCCIINYMVHYQWKTHTTLRCTVTFRARGRAREDVLLHMKWFKLLSVSENNTLAEKVQERERPNQLTRRSGVSMCQCWSEEDKFITHTQTRLHNIEVKRISLSSTFDTLH